MTNKLILTISFTLIAVLSFGQTTEQEQKTSEKRTNRIEASHTKAEADINDGYMGKKQHILRRLNVSEIPADCPTYKEGLTKEQYITQIKTWVKANQNLIKEEFKKELDK